MFEFLFEKILIPLNPLLKPSFFIHLTETLGKIIDAYGSPVVLWRGHRRIRFWRIGLLSRLSQT